MQLYKAVRLANWGSTLLSPLRFWCDNWCLHVRWSVGQTRGFPRVLLFPTRQRPHERKLQYIGDCFILDLSCNNMFRDFGKLNMKYSWQNITAEWLIYFQYCREYVRVSLKLQLHSYGVTHICTHECLVLESIAMASGDSVLVQHCLEYVSVEFRVVLESIGTALSDSVLVRNSAE